MDLKKYKINIILDLVFFTLGPFLRIIEVDRSFTFIIKMLK